MRIVPPTPENIDAAAKLLRDGKLIGMPTETVYGIAANAFDENAVAATFAAKGRPAENPLIVHVASIAMVEEVSSSSVTVNMGRDLWSIAERLMKEFCPGPLTLVLSKASRVPSIVTGGLHTVAVRMPAHPVALQLIRAAGTPLSAPSANLFTALSPTNAQMIDAKIAQHLDLIIDGGPCDVGIESTVVDLTESPPRILRPGAISKEMIEAVLGAAAVAGDALERRSPGMYEKHYAPKAAAKIVDELAPGQAGLTFEKPNGPNQIQMSPGVADYARELYQALNDLDHMRIGTIYIQSPPRSAEWEAVWDRLNKLTS